MICKVRLSPHAVNEYKKLPSDIKPEIQEGLDSLAKSPFAGPKVKRLKGRLREYFRYRVQDYRIVYTVDQKAAIVYVDYIQHRREIYRNIK